MTKDSEPSPSAADTPATDAPATDAKVEQQPDGSAGAPASGNGEGSSGLADRARRLILKRRRFFVASALMGLSAAGCENNNEPQVCLSPVSVPEPGPQTNASASSSADKPDAGTPDKPEPAPTGSSSAKPPRPRVCLKIYIPPDAGPEEQG